VSERLEIISLKWINKTFSPKTEALQIWRAVKLYLNLKLVTDLFRI